MPHKESLFSLSFTFFSLLVITQFIKGGYNIAIVKEERILPRLDADRFRLETNRL